MMKYIGKIWFRLHLLLFVFLVIALIIIKLSSSAKANSYLKFTPPTKIKLEMVALADKGNIDYINYPDPHCSPTGEISKTYGCTYYDGNIGLSPPKPYPFTSYEIEIGYQSELLDGVEQGYLANVTPHEVAIGVSSQDNKPPACLKAQAVAARTFAFNQTYNPANPTDTFRINNSNQKQVYIPYRYLGLTQAQQTRIDQAVAEILYLTLPDDTLPIRAHYGEDNPAFTTEITTTSYLKSVHDPISAQYGRVRGTTNGGMSSKGCSRWAFGHNSSRGPVAASDPHYPHDNQGDGDFWSVRWETYEQILSHYYTNIVIRDAEGNIITPAYRWTPLQVDWGGGAINPPLLTMSQTYTVSLLIQNTGVLSFSQVETTTTFTCWWENQTGQQTPCSTVLTLPSLAPGQSITLTFPLQTPPTATPGLHTLSFDAAQGDTFFQQREVGKPWFTWQTQVCVGGCYRLYVPLLSKKVTYFYETFTSLNEGWHFYSEDTDRLPNYVRIYHTDGHNDSHALYITEQVNLFSYTSGALITITTPLSLSVVTLSFWVKRLDDTYGAYDVHLNGTIVASERAATQTWHQIERTIHLSQPTRHLVLDVRVPAQLGYRHVLLFDDITFTSP